MRNSLSENPKANQIKHCLCVLVLLGSTLIKRLVMCVFQLFLASMAFVFFAKAFGGAYMKSSITQIERRFDIPSSLIGVIDGSFEMGMYSFLKILVGYFLSYINVFEKKKKRKSKILREECM